MYSNDSHGLESLESWSVCLGNARALTLLFPQPLSSSPPSSYRREKAGKGETPSGFRRLLCEGDQLRHPWGAMAGRRSCHSSWSCSLLGRGTSWFSFPTGNTSEALTSSAPGGRLGTKTFTRTSVSGLQCCPDSHLYEGTGLHMLLHKP